MKLINPEYAWKVAEDWITVWDCNCSEYGKQPRVMAVDDLLSLPTIDALPVDAIETYIAMLKEAECTQSARVIENMLKEIGIEPKSERPKSDRSNTKDAMEQEN